MPPKNVSMQQILQFLQTLDEYAAGKADLASVRTVMIEQASAAPQLTGAMIAAISASQRAGEMEAAPAQDLIEWLRAFQATLSIQAQATEHEDVTQPARQQPQRPAAGQAPGKTGESLQDSIAEGLVLKKRYLLEQKIGEGGMGLVFRARDLEEERIAREQQGTQIRQYLAIKVLRPDRREFSKAVLEEVRNTRVLVHQNIIRAGDCQQDGDLIFMTMEYLEGRTLDVLLDQDFAQGMPLDRAWSIIEGMGAGLAYAHDHGLIHCDFKPSNVFITHSFSPKILDFGIARAARGSRSRSASGAPIGMTRRYASPEMIDAWQENQMAGYRPDRRDDIFALACVVVELLTGRHPFEEEDSQRARQQRVRLPAISGLSPRQNNAIARAMALEREKRTARVEDFVAELMPQVRDVAKALPDPPTARTRRVVPPVWGRRVALVAAIALLAASSYALWQRHRNVPVASSTPASAEARQASDLLDRLGIKTTAGQASLSKDDFRALVRTAPRSFRLGSTAQEIRAALALCQANAQSTVAENCSIDSYADETTREGKLTPFELDPGLVTVRQFRQFADAKAYHTGAERRGYAYQFTGRGLTRMTNGSWRNAVSAAQARDDQPVVGVDFDDAQAYCRWKGRRLPNENEWEYVARGPSRQLFPWGNDPSIAPRADLLPAAGHGPKEGIGGLYQDLGSVVWQWVDSEHAMTDDAGQVVTGKVLKGGSWRDTNSANERAAVRRYSQRNVADDITGFRCAASAAAWPDADFWLASD
jgi:serine/threonine protein kinase